jgi:hypothetical protein
VKRRPRGPEPIGIVSNHYWKFAKIKILLPRAPYIYIIYIYIVAVTEIGTVKLFLF